MNERIKQLAIEAKLIAPEANGFDQTNLSKAHQKFAQLIVQDCLAQVDKVDAMLDDPKEKVGVSWVGLAIAKHWGLE
jgi:hypothetical protein